MDISQQVKELDAMVSQGAIVDAVKKFFADAVSTSDYGSVVTNNKSEHIAKMESFTSSIAKVNGITHHRTLIDDAASASEFTFDFDMKDGSKIYWHEIIRRLWNGDGKVINEQYFNAE